MKPMIIVQPGQGGGELFPPLSQIGCRLHPLPPLWQAVLVVVTDESSVTTTSTAVWPKLLWLRP